MLLDVLYIQKSVKNEVCQKHIFGTKKVALRASIVAVLRRHHRRGLTRTLILWCEA
jgi:hypothetical protein